MSQAKVETPDQTEFQQSLYECDYYTLGPCRRWRTTNSFPGKPSHPRHRGPYSPTATQDREQAQHQLPRGNDESGYANDAGDPERHVVQRRAERLVGVLRRAQPRSALEKEATRDRVTERYAS